jgi:hypothetical protein
MKLMVLDLATVAGFCVGDEAGVQDHGSFKLPSTGGDIGTFLSAYRTWLLAAIDRWAPTEIVFEMPILPSTTNLATVRKLYSLCGVTELLAKERAIRCAEANLMDIRRHFIGASRAPSCVPAKERRQWIKERTISECRRRGFRPIDDNAGDALALFSFVMTSRRSTFLMLGNEIERAA